MKIFYIITLADLGGAQSVVINLANKAIDDGFDVFVISEQSGPMWDILDSKITKIKIKELERKINPIKEIKVLWKLKQLYKEFNPDVVHLHSSKIGLLGRLAFPWKKIVYTVHGFDSIRIAFKKFLPIERFLQSRTKFIVGVSKYDVVKMKEERITHNVTYIYNGIKDFSLEQNKSVNESLIDFFVREREQGTFIVLCIARLSPQKKFDLFCDVAEKMRANKNIKFVWIGNNYFPKNLPDNVFCLGEAKNAFYYLKFADIFMLPSNYEGLPMSIIEALCSSVPVLASDVGGVSEILNDKNGYALKNIPEFFVNKLQDFYEGTLNYESFKKNARESFENYFTVDAMYNSYKKLYKKIKN